MSSRAVLTTLVELPNELAAAWLQHVRDFDVKHANCRFRIIGSVDKPTDDMVTVLESVSPSFDEIMVVAKGHVHGGDKDEEAKNGGE